MERFIVKHLKYFLIPVFCFILAINSFATSFEANTYEFSDEATTVVFEENSVWSAEEQQEIAAWLVYGAPDIQTYAWCWLTGHDYVTETITLTKHKAAPTVPRCLEQVYQVSTCSKCDKMTEELIYTTYIFCCSED